MCLGCFQCRLQQYSENSHKWVEASQWVSLSFYETVDSQLSAMNCGICLSVLLCTCMCVCDGRACCCVVVLWWGVHHWACLFWCAAFLLLSTSQGLRGTQGGVHTTGPRWAELVTPIVSQQTHPFGVLLSLHCHPASQHGPADEASRPDARLFCSPRSLASRRRWLQSRCTCCCKGKMDVSMLLSLSKAWCWHNNLPPTSTNYVWHIVF